MHWQFDINGGFCNYKWNNIRVGKMYHFIETILKISFISSDFTGFSSLWYPPTYAKLSPTCQFEVKDHSLWMKEYTSYSRFLQILWYLIQKVVQANKEINIISCKMKSLSWASQQVKLLILAENFLVMNEVPSTSTYCPLMQSNGIKLNEYIVDSLNLQMLQVDMISFTTLTCIRAKMKT